MPRLPQPGADTGTWGTVLNDFLSVEHAPDGTHRNGPVNVKSFGAKGNGTTDDTAAIQNAFTYAHTNGGPIYFPAGVYLITQELVITKAGLNVVGAGAEEGGTIIQAGTALPRMLRMRGQKSCVRDINLDGNSLALVGLCLQNAARSLIQNVVVERTQQFGFSFHNGAVTDVHGNNNSASLVKCTATANNGVGFGTPDMELDNNAISLFSCSSTRNKSHGLFYRGLGLTVFGGHFEGNTGYGIKIGDAADGATSQAVTMHEPWIEANALGGVVFSKGTRCVYYRISVSGTQDVDWDNSIGENLQIAPNTKGFTIVKNGAGTSIDGGAISFNDGGVTLYVQNGALKYRGANGTVTTIAQA